MIGAIIGDIVGSIYEMDNIKTKEFPFFSEGCRPTDDSILTLAIAKTILQGTEDDERVASNTVRNMQEIGRQYPDCGFGPMFLNWLFEEDPQPYGSYGNGSAMRVSPCGFAANSVEEAKRLSALVSGVSHDHPEGMKGAEAVCVCIWMALNGATKEEIRSCVQEHYYNMDFTLDEIRAAYRFDATCQGSVPQALEAFFEAEDFEDAVRNAISIGGDSDTLASIAGALGEAYYGVPDRLRREAEALMDPLQLGLLREFENVWPGKRSDV